MEHEEAVRRSRLFTVRLWSEATGDGADHRGNVRDVESGAFRNFREWSDLTAFLTTQIEDQPMSESEPEEMS